MESNENVKDASETGSWTQRVKLAVFGKACVESLLGPRAVRFRTHTPTTGAGVFHSMRERDASHRVTRANQLWTLFLLCIDAIQVWCAGRVVRARVSSCASFVLWSIS